ncbi:MAG TPA: hypothetical protein VFO95_14475, partial [Gemmatimonadales bacterium]|nr:hypothetical protein [Gemmatimonadales bacterium]
MPCSRPSLLLGLLPLLAAAPLAAQSTGRITGRVVEADRGTPVGGAVVELVGSTPLLSATSGIDGRY